MKRLLLTLCVAGLISGTAYAASPVNRREHNQRERIRQGVQSGELTRIEAARLKAEQERIRAAEARAKANGSVSAREAARLDHRLDAASKQIFRQKHDRQDR